MNNLYARWFVNENIVKSKEILSATVNGVAFRHVIVATNVAKGGIPMEQYVRPEVLASFSEEEVVEEAAVCASYGLPVINIGGGN